MAHSQVRVSAVISYLTAAFNGLAGLLYTPWLVRTLGDSDYGLYTLTMAVIGVFTMDFGIGAAVSKYMSMYCATGDDERAAQFLGIVYRMYAFVALIVGLALAAVYFNLDTLYSRLTAFELDTLKTLFIIAGTYSVLSLPFTPQNGILLANERLVALKTTGLAQKVVSVLLIVSALLMGMGVTAVVTANAVVGLFFILVRARLIRRTTQIKPLYAFRDRVLHTQVLYFSGWTALGLIAGRMIFNITPAIIGAISGAASVAIFGLASSIEGYVYSVSEALNGLFLPRVSRIIATVSDPSGPILELMVRVGRIQLYLIGLIVLGFGIVGPDFVDLWIGPDYGTVYVSALLLIIPGLLELPQQIGTTAVVATGNVRAQSIVGVIMAAVNIALVLLLVGPLGVVGAAAAILASSLVRLIGMNAVYARRIGIDVNAFFVRMYGTWIAPAVLTLLAGLWSRELISLDGWIGVMVQIGLITAVYAAAIYFMALNCDERMAVHSALRRLRIS